MINSERVLNDIIKTCQMGIQGIDIVMDKTSEPALRQALKVQRKEYSDLEAEGKLLAQRKGISIEQIGAVTKRMSAWLSRGQLLVGEPNSKIAGMMIQGNTRGVILVLKNTSRCDPPRRTDRGAGPEAPGDPEAQHRVHGALRVTSVPLRA